MTSPLYPPFASDGQQLDKLSRRIFEVGLTYSKLRFNPKPLIVVLVKFKN